MSFFHRLAIDIKLCAIASDFRIRCNKSQSNGIPAMGFGPIIVSSATKKGWQSKEHYETMKEDNLTYNGLLLGTTMMQDALILKTYLWG